MLHEPSECFVYAKPCRREDETACMMVSIAHYQEAFNQLRQVGAERDDLRKRLQARISALEAERDRLKTELKAEKVKHYTLALEWLCEPENFQIMEAVYPDTIRRLAASIGGEGK